jgi:RNA polymerase sigma-70 factor (ECF subfamily)
MLQREMQALTMESGVLVRSEVLPLLPAETARERSSDPLVELMTRVRLRDATAFEELYELTVGKVLALARGVLRDRAEAEEVACEVYEQAWTNASGFDAERGGVLAWLLVMCRSRALDRLRRRRESERRQLRWQEQETEDFAAAPEETLELFQRDSAVRAALAALSPLRRRLVAFAFFRGMSHQEIAQEVGMPLGTVKSHLRRALLELKDSLAASGLAVEARPQGGATP